MNEDQDGGTGGGREVYMYDLTPMIGRGSQGERRSVAFMVDMKRSTRTGHIVAILVTLPVLVVSVYIIRALPLIPIVVSIVPALAAYVATLFMVLAKTRKGLRQSQWRAFYDRQRATLGEFIQCGAVVDPLASVPLIVEPAGIPSDVPTEWDTDLLIDEVTHR